MRMPWLFSHKRVKQKIRLMSRGEAKPKPILTRLSKMSMMKNTMMKLTITEMKQELLTLTK
jgi:hypothetical protein